MYKGSLVAVALVFLSMSTAQMAVAATNYYVRNGGDDSFDGKSSATAWKTLKNVNAQSFLPGDSILFERGGLWNERLQISSSGSKDGWITYGAYGEGERPKLSGLVEVPGWQSESNWTDRGANIWSIPVSGSNYARVWIDGMEKERARAYNDHEGVTQSRPWQKFSSVLYVYSTANPATAYNSIKLTSGNFVAGSGSKNYFTLSNLDIQGWERITLSGCSHVIIEHCDIGKNSSAHGIELQRDGSVLSTDGIIRYCTIDSEFPFWTVRDEGDGGLIRTQYGLRLASGGQIDWDIHDNYFAGWGYCTFSFVNHDENGYMVEGIRFFNNYVTQEGLSYGRWFAGHQYVAQVNEHNPIEIFNNVFYEASVQSQIGVPYLRIYNNVFNGARGSNDQGGTDGNALSFSGYTGRMPYKTKIHNNVFANCVAFGMLWSVRPDRDPVVDCEVVNNIFFNNGRYAWQVNDEYEKVINPVTANNLFYSDATTDVIRVYSTKMTVDEFNALDGTGHQQFDPSGNIQADPLFVDPENGDFRLQANSPAIGAGLAPISATDAAGNVWNDSPSIGPFEYLAPTRVSQSVLSQSSPAFTFSTTPGAIVIERGQLRGGSIEVALYDGRGRRVSSLRDSGGKSLRVETKAFAPGVYTVQIKVDGTSSMRRVVVGGQRQVRM